MVFGGCSVSQRAKIVAKSDLLPFAMKQDDIVFLNTMGEVVHRVPATEEYTVAAVLNKRYFYTVNTAEDPFVYALYDADGRIVAELAEIPVAVSDDHVAVYVDDLTPELASRGVVALPFKALTSEIGWVDSAGLLFVCLDNEDRETAVLDVLDEYSEVKRYQIASISAISDQLVHVFDRKRERWVIGHNLNRVSGENTWVQTGPTGPYYTRHQYFLDEDGQQLSGNIQVCRMGEVLFQLPAEFIRAHVFASGLIWAETFREEGFVYTIDGEILEQREGWQLYQATTPCSFALFEIEGEEGVFVVDENIEIVAHIPSDNASISITHEGYIRSRSRSEPHRVFDQYGGLIWEDISPVEASSSP
jgi:hypothetical protein